MLTMLKHSGSKDHHFYHYFSNKLADTLKDLTSHSIIIRNLGLSFKDLRYEKQKHPTNVKRKLYTFYHKKFKCKTYGINE